jgi:small-conductance mechanosensitive channel
MHEQKKPRKRAIMLDQNTKSRSHFAFFGCARGRLWRIFARAGLRRGLWALAAALVIGGFNCNTMAAEAPQPEPSKAATAQEAALVVANQPITVFRASFGGLNPQERAAQATERIKALPLGSASAEVKVEPIKIGAEEGVVFNINSSPLFFLATGDLPADSKQTLNAEAQNVVSALRTALQKRVDEGQWSALLMSAARVLIATLLLLGLLWLWRRARIGLLRILQTTAFLPEKYLRVFAVDLRMHILEVGRAAIHLISVAVLLLLGYWWFVYSLEQFPYTASFGETLETFLIHLFSDFGRGVLTAIPGLVAVVIIILIARWAVRLINAVFQEVENGRLSLAWLERETARTTRMLLIGVVWLFALVVAYPYIPGSDTNAFKGLSVLIGLMITLGSTGLINQVISGLFVIYSKSVKSGDYVRVGDIEGEVMNVGSLATKIRTPRQEEITLPHSVLVGTATTNYSRLSGEDGMVVTVSVTIGYDAPWRQVHELLLLGASRTPGIRKAPPPRVLQRELSDFYAQYQLLAHLEEGQSRAAVLSDLHAQIQDAFNEYGVQIMSPHFETQPRKPVVVPKSGWYAPPASSPDSGTANEPDAVGPRQVDTRATLSATPEPKPGQSRIAKTERRRPPSVRGPRPKPPTI